MKDNFSVQSAEYARFRPGYPDQMYTFLYAHTRALGRAWDCATGNGQIAASLAQRFEVVEATDISAQQLQHAIPAPNVHYRVEQAEQPGFPDACFDLICVGQAAHWFDFDAFYPAVRRVMRPGGLLALPGYHLLRIDEQTDALIDHLYTDVLGAYWDAERRLVDDRYRSIPFPFSEIPFPEMASEYEWTSTHLLGYLSTWSAVQHYTKEHGKSPVNEAFIAALEKCWPSGVLRTVRFPIFGRCGVVE